MSWVDLRVFKKASLHLKYHKMFYWTFWSRDADISHLCSCNAIDLKVSREVVVFGVCLAQKCKTELDINGMELLLRTC